MVLVDVDVVSFGHVDVVVPFEYHADADEAVLLLLKILLIILQPSF
jgi:hypothetical protein